MSGGFDLPVTARELDRALSEHRKLQVEWEKVVVALEEVVEGIQRRVEKLEADNEDLKQLLLCIALKNADTKNWVGIEGGGPDGD